MKVKVGQTFDVAALDADYTRLWKSGKFLFIDRPKVLPEGDGVRIVIAFVERDRIGKVDIAGNRYFGDATLREDMRTREQGLLDSVALRDDAQRIESRYREKGFLFATVAAKSAGDAAGTVVTFTVDEGPWVSVRAITFRGNSAFESAELEALMSIRPRSFFFGLPHSGIFDQELYLEDLRRLRQFYVRNGYFDAIVSSEDLSFSFDRSQLHLRIRIEEGSRYIVSRVEFEVKGRGVFPESILRSKVRLGDDDPYQGETVESDLRAIQKLYTDAAYVDADVTIKPVVRLTGNEVVIRYVIEEGEKIYIDGVEIRGNTKTRDKVIRRELTFYPGEEINSEKLKESFSNLHRLHYFDDAYPTLEPAAAAPNRRTVVVNVKERDTTGNILFSFGVASGSGFVGSTSLIKNNFDITDTPSGFWDLADSFTGGGQTLLLDATPGSRFSRYRFDFREPRLLDSLTSLNLRGVRADLLRDAYQEKRLAGEIALGQRYFADKKLFGELAYRFELIDISDLDSDAAPDVVAVRGSTRASALALRVEYDRRLYESRVGPYAGWMAEASYEYTGGFLGAQLDMSKGSAAVAASHTVFSNGDEDRHIVSFRSSFGWSEAHHNTRSVPIFERYFLGGPRSVRGFRFRGLGPHFNDDSIGGTVEQFGSLEYTLPLYHDVIRGIAFADYGNLAEDIDEFRWEEYRVTLGGGVLLNVNLPLFGPFVPISLTWGEAVRTEPGDRPRQFLFDIGIAF